MGRMTKEIQLLNINTVADFDKGQGEKSFVCMTTITGLIRKISYFVYIISKDA